MYVLISCPQQDQGSAPYSHLYPQLKSIFKQITRPIPKVLFREWMNATEEESWSRFLCLSRQVDLLYFSSTAGYSYSQMSRKQEPSRCVIFTSTPSGPPRD